MRTGLTLIVGAIMVGGGFLLYAERRQQSDVLRATMNRPASSQQLAGAQPPPDPGDWIIEGAKGQSGSSK